MNFTQGNLFHERLETRKMFARRILAEAERMAEDAADEIKAIEQLQNDLARAIYNDLNDNAGDTQ